MSVFFWVGLGPKSLLYAVLFCLLALPFRQTVVPFWKRYRKEKLRIVLAVLFLVALTFVLSFRVSVLLTIDALAIVELAERARDEHGHFRARALSIGVCAAYMFCGVIVVLVYNDIIATSRYPLSYDAALNLLDAALLGGKSVTGIASAAFAVLPEQVLRFLDAAYFQMFLLLGAALFLSAYQSLRRGLQFVGTCLTAYYLSLLIFYLWPTYGPYVYSPLRVAEFPSYLTTYAFQNAGMVGLEAIAQHRIWNLGSGFYIAFPSMHIGLPVIAMWFCRRLRPVFWVLAAYTCVAAVAVVVLEWHYALDVPGGVIVAALALIMAGESPEPGVQSCP